MMNILELRKVALRKIIARSELGYVYRYALGKPWLESTALNEMAWTDFKKIYMNFEKLKETFDATAQRTPSLEYSVKPSHMLMPDRYKAAVLAALAHESLHNMWLHKVREKGKDHRRWIAACEWSINTYLANNFPYFIEDLGVMFPPEDARRWINNQGLCPTTDAFYQYLMTIPDCSIPESKGCRHCDHSDDPNEIPDPYEQLVMARGLPEGEHKVEVLRYLANAQTKIQSIPWEQLLLGGIEDAMEQEQTWQVPNRRMPDAPGWRREKLLSFTWILDVSPSIDDDMKRSFVNTLQAGINLYHDAQHRVIFFAGRVVKDLVISAGTDLSEMRVPSGDFTDLTDVWAILERDKPDYALVLTDLELSPVPEPSHTKVVWGVIGDYAVFNPEYGVRIDLPDLN